MSQSTSKNIAAVFPGQGSQSVGMGKELFDNFKIYEEALEEASDAIKVDFKELCFNDPNDKLQLTENTQPAIVASSVAAFRVLNKEYGFTPSYVAGHSVGEYSALVASKTISFTDAIKAVKLRGQSMQEAVPVGEGAMAALLGPSDEQAVAICKWVESQHTDWILEAANFNCPGQVVISGQAHALKWLEENISNFELNPQPKRVKLIPLKVSAPFHSRMMLPAEQKMSSFLDEIAFSTPSFALVQNITANEVSDAAEIKKNLIKQISGSVLWSKSINYIKSTGLNSYVEVGAGTTLSGLIKKIDNSDLSLFNTSSLENLKSFENFLA